MTTEDAGRVDSALRAGGDAGGGGQRQDATPDIIGRAFVKEYYTRLNSEPSSLVNFYGDECQVLHFDADDEAPRPVSGRDAVRKRIEAHKFRNCLAVISYIDAVAVTDVRGVLILVMGKLSNDGREYRRFVQNFLLVSRDSPSGMKYHVCVNDVFRFLDPEEPLVEQRTVSVAEAEVVPPNPVERMSADAPPSREAHVKDVDASAGRGPPAAEERHPVDDRGERPPRQDAMKAAKTEVGEATSTSGKSKARRTRKPVERKSAPHVSSSDSLATRVADQSWTRGVGTKADDAAKQPDEASQPVAASVDSVAPASASSAPRVEEATVPASGASTAAATPSVAVSAAGSDSSAASATLPPAGSRSLQQFHPVGGSPQVASIYVSRLPRNVTQSQLEEEFSRFGRIKRVVVKEKDHPYAFVDFEENESMQKSLSGPVRLDGQLLLVEEKTNPTRRNRGMRGRGSDRSFPSPAGVFGGSPRASPRGSDRSRGRARTERRRSGGVAAGYRDSG